MTKKRAKRVRINAGWHVERIDTTPGLYRLIGPLKTQTSRKKTICIAIGSKRLKGIIDVLNEVGALV